MDLEIFRGLHPNFSAIPSLSEKGKPPGRAQNAPRAGLMQVVSGPTRPKRLVLRRCVRRPSGDLQLPAVMAQRSVFFMGLSL